MFELSLMETFFVALMGVIIVAVTNCCDELFTQYHRGVENLKDNTNKLKAKIDELEKENRKLKTNITKIDEEGNLIETEKKELQSLRIRCYMLELELHKTKETVDSQTLSYFKV